MIIDNIENNNVYEFNRDFGKFIPIWVLNHKSFNKTESGATNLIESSQNWTWVGAKKINTKTLGFDHI